MNVILTLTNIKDLVIRVAAYNRKVESGEISGEIAVMDFWTEDEENVKGDNLVIMCDTVINEDRTECSFIDYKIAEVAPEHADEIAWLFDETSGFVEGFVELWNKSCDDLKISLD